MLFSKKNEALEQLQAREADLALLMECMQRYIDGDYSRVSEEGFNDTALVQRFNQVLDSAMDRNNRMLMRLNDAMNRIGDSELVKNMLEEVDSQTTSIADMKESSSGMGVSIANIQNSAENIRESSHTIISSSRDCMDKMNESLKLVSDGARSMGDVATEMTGFKEKAKKITEIIDQVRELAEDSSLLGLNASIEAARAGEAGRGFAVVAEQVNQLSRNTAECADDVVKYVGELLSGITALVDSVNNTMGSLNKGNDSVHESIRVIESMNRQLEEINGDIDNINDEITNQSTVTDSFVSDIAHIADSYQTLSADCQYIGERFFRISRDIDNARSDMFRRNSRPTLLDNIKVYEIDHLIFTWRIYNHIAGFETLRLEQVNNPTKCKVGVWFSKQKDPVIVNSPGFKKAFDAHARLHDRAVAAWEAVERGDRDEAMEYFYRALDEFAVYREGLNELMDTLRQNGMDEETPVWVFGG